MSNTTIGGLPELSGAISANDAFAVEVDGVTKRISFSALKSAVGEMTIIPRTFTENGVYDPEDDGAGAYGEVTVNVPTASTLITKTITENGTYAASGDDADGYSSVTVNVGGGVETLDWRDTFSVNWDFSNPVNTRNFSFYSSSSLIYSIDGWQLQGGKLSFVNGGIKLERFASGTWGYFMQKYKQYATSAMVGRQFTLSCLVDGVLAYRTANFPSGGNGTAGTQASGVVFRIFNYGSEAAVTIDIAANTGDHVIQAIKLEAGATQTLATQVNGVWVLNNRMDADTEYVKARNGTVYDS